jgi:hypothetical protein
MVNVNLNELYSLKPFVSLPSIVPIEKEFYLNYNRRNLILKVLIIRVNHWNFGVSKTIQHTLITKHLD